MGRSCVFAPGRLPTTNCGKVCLGLDARARIKPGSEVRGTVFALSEILDAPWARSAVSEQFIVWRGEASEWKLYLPGRWPSSTWLEPPAELVIEGTETIRSLIGGEEWRAFTAQTAPLFELIDAFPNLGHWNDDEGIEPFVPFLRSGIALLDLGADRFTVAADASVCFVPSGLPPLEDAQVQTLLEKKPKTWKARPPRGNGWAPAWQLLWLWLEAARQFWGTHFVNPVAALERPYADLPVSEPRTVVLTPAAAPAPAVGGGLGPFLSECFAHNLEAGLRIARDNGGWAAHIVVAHAPGEPLKTDAAVRRVEEIARRTGLASLLPEGAWSSGWTHSRAADHHERWRFEVVSPPVALAAAAPWIADLR